MVDPIALQILIGILGVFAVIALAANRIFLGAVIASIAQPIWIWVSYTAEQWGAVVVLSLYLVAYLLSVIARWPRNPPPVKDEEEWLGV